LKAIQSAINDISYYYSYRKQVNGKLSILITPQKKVVLEHRDGSGGFGSRVIPEVRRQIYQTFMLESAIIDKAIMVKFLAAYDQLSELSHIRDMIIDMICSDDPIEKSHLEALPQYANQEIKDTFLALDDLYRVCTGKPLKEVRIR
jgi:hypothetical protein